MTGPETATRLSLAFAQDTMDLDALQRAAYALARFATADIRVDGADYAVTLFPRGEGVTEGALADLAHRFRAEANDHVLRARIARETDPLRNLVFALAFSATGLIEGEAAGSADDDADDTGPDGVAKVAP
ncbi:MAG TPA: hypothetical protein VGD91_15640 [Trebonia sp.]